MAFRRLHQAFKHLGSKATATAAGGPSRRATRNALPSLRGCGGGAAYGIERLESRRLLTTLTGTIGLDGQPKEPDVFEYRQTHAGEDIVIRVKLAGDTVVELIAAQVNRLTNEVNLVNLPGNRNGLPVFGGFDGGVGLSPIGTVVVQGPGGVPFETNIAAIAAGGAGTFYAFNVLENVGVQVVQLALPPGNSGPVIGTVIGTLNNIDAVTGADVAPNGNLVFVGTSGAGATRLFTVNPALANPATPQDEVAQSLTSPQPGPLLPAPPPDTEDPETINSIAFIGGQLVGVLNEGDEGDSQLITINQATGTIGGAPTDIEVDGDDAGTITGIDVDNEGQVIAIGSGEDAGILAFLDTNGGPISNGAIGLGELGTENASGLAFVPGVADPFTGNAAGAFIGIDAANDQLFFINTLDRDPAQFLWNVYVDRASLDSNIAIGYVRDTDDDPPDPFVIRPYEGSAPDLRIVNAQNGQFNVVSPGANTGQALIGALSQDIIDDTEDEENIPFDALPVPQSLDFGVFPAAEFETLNSGLVVDDDSDLGKFLFGGTFTGAVDARRNLDLFYAGWVLTGDAGGQVEGSPTIPDNFKVNGDLRSLISLDSFGSSGDGGAAPSYVTGFDMQIGGTLGQVKTAEAFYGRAEVAHLDNAPHIGRSQREVEFHDNNVENLFEQFNLGGSGALANAAGLPDSTASATPGSNVVTFNDSFDTPEYLGSIRSAELGRAEVVRVQGRLQKTTDLDDPADYYAVSLMAGQQVTVRLRQNTPAVLANSDDLGTELPVSGGLIALGVFDPDGRLIATDYNNVDLAETLQQFFTFKADRPGIYRFAVAAVGDVPEYTGGGPEAVGVVPYTLTAVGVGDVALAGIVARGTILDLPELSTSSGGSFDVFRGDLGAIKSYGSILSQITTTYANVELGDLRAMDAVNIGALFINSPLIDVPEGSVGLVRASGGALVLNFNNIDVPAIGGDYQLVDGPVATVAVNLRANRAIGVIRAGNMATPAPSELEVNADDTGDDGVIDLIDVEGDMGTFPAGGPQISTNTRGNVRFIRVGGQPYRDVFFGNTSPEQTNIPPGRSQAIIDDSGSRMTFTSAGTAIRNPFFNPAFPNAGIEEFIGSRIQLITYPIRDKGGSVVINATSESGMTVGVSGGPTAELGRVEIAGVGREVRNGVIAADPTVGSNDGVQLVANDVVADPDSPTGTRQSLVLDPREDTDDAVPLDLARMSPDDLFLRVEGDARVDVLNVIVIDNGGHENLDIDGNVEVVNLGDEDLARPTDLGNAVSIVNATGGDILNVTAESVGELASTGNLGMMRSTTGTLVEGLAPLTVGGALAPRTPLPVFRPRPTRAPQGAAAVGLAQPFLNLREGIAINGNVISMRAGKAIGNVVVSSGSVGEIVANADGNDDPSLFEGINGTVYVAVGGAPVANLPGRINRVQIGEGVLSSGTGNFQRAGLVAEGIIGPVSGQNADIRGDLIALNTYRVLTQTTVVVTVNGQSTITRTIVNPSHTPIERVTLTNGSIIDADIFASAGTGDAREFVALTTPEFTAQENFNQPDFEIGRVSIRGNGGIIGTRFAGADINTIDVADGGFGLLNSLVQTTGDGTVNRLEVSGYGIREVEVSAGRVGEIIANGDGTSLSTNAVNPRVRVSEGNLLPNVDSLVGVLDPISGTLPNRLTDVHRFLGTINQQGVQPEISGVTDTGIIDNLNASGQRDLRAVRAWQIRNQSRLDFGNSVGTIAVRDIINGMELTTGTLKNFSLNQDAFAMTLNVSGRVKKIDIQGSLAGNSLIRTQGTGGQIDNVNVRGNLIGNIESARSIKTINVGGDLTGNVTVNSGGTAIKTMKVGGAFLGGKLEINGNVGTIQSAGSLGALGDTLTINGNLGKLVVGGDLRANVRVTNSLKTLQVKGSIVDGGIEDGLIVDVSNTLNSLQVGGDIQPGVEINARAIKKQRVGGQSLGEVVIA